jgi:hypothetical protein
MSYSYNLFLIFFYKNFLNQKSLKVCGGTVVETDIRYGDYRAD